MDRGGEDRQTDPNVSVLPGWGHLCAAILSVISSMFSMKSSIINAWCDLLSYSCQKPSNGPEKGVITDPTRSYTGSEVWQSCSQEKIKHRAGNEGCIHFHSPTWLYRKEWLLGTTADACRCLQNTTVMFTLIYYLLQNLQFSFFPQQPANY